MGKDFAACAEGVLAAVGGAGNVRSNMACMTRLRVQVADASAVDVEALKGVDGVMHVVEDGDRFEVVFGPGTVNKVLDEFAKLTGIKPGDAGEADVLQAAADNKAAQKAKHDKPVQRFLKRIGNIFVPLLPGIIAAGLINGITNVIGVSTGGSLNGIWWYAAIRTMGWALFLYLPLLVGMNSCKEFGGSGVLGAMAGALSIANVAMPLMAKAKDGAALVSLPFALPTPAFADGAISITMSTTYNAAAGGLLGALICGWFFALLERNLHKVMPSTLDTFFTPLLTVGVGSIVAVIALQPIGAFLTQGIFFVLQFFYDTLGAFGAYLLPILMMAGGGQVGAGLALYVRTKNQRVRTYLRESIPVGILGVGEPLMYAVTLPLGKPFVCACLGSGVGGVLAWLFHLGTVSQGVSGLFGLLIVVPGTQLYYVIAMLAAYAAGFALTYFFGVDESRINDVFGE